MIDELLKVALAVERSDTWLAVIVLNFDKY